MVYSASKKTESIRRILSYILHYSYGQECGTTDIVHHVVSVRDYRDSGITGCVFPWQCLVLMQRAVSASKYLEVIWAITFLFLCHPDIIGVSNRIAALVKVPKTLPLKSLY